MKLFACHQCKRSGGEGYCLYLLPECPEGHGELSECDLAQFVRDNTHEKAKHT
jgi:hypothetical protein